MAEFYYKNDGIQDILVAEMQQKILIIDIYKCDDILFYILHVIISFLVYFSMKTTAQYIKFLINILS